MLYFNKFFCGLLLSLLTTPVFTAHAPSQLEDSLVFHAPFKNDIGFSVYEEVTSTYSGTLTNAVLLENGISFDGNGDELYFAKSEITRIKGAEISVSAWIKLDGTRGTSSILSKNFAYEFKVVNGHLELDLVLAGFQKFRAKTTVPCITPGIFHHVAAVRDSSVISFLVDGQKILSEYLDEQSAQNLYPANNDIYIGSSKGKEWLDGIVYDAKVYKLALDSMDMANQITGINIPDIPPMVDAGPNRFVVMPAGNIVLEGSAMDYHGLVDTYYWEQTSGPLLTVSGDTLKGISPGEYRMKYTAIDTGGNSNSDEMFIWCYESGRNLLFVSAYGNDSTGNGTFEKPLKTINRAIEIFSGKANKVIHLLPDTFIINSKVVMPDGVSLLGSGMDHTILLPSADIYSQGTDINHSLLEASNITGGARYGHFTINGINKKLCSGVTLKSVENVELEYVKVEETYFAGLGLVNVRNSLIHDIELINTAWGSAGYSSGAISMGNGYRVDLYNLFISEGLLNKPDNWGYAIKAYQIGGSSFMKHVRIFNSKLELHDYGFWNIGQAKNIGIEYHNTSIDSCEIFNIETNHTISLVPNKYNEGSKQMRVHHNVLYASAGPAIESYMNICEIDHNNFLGESFSIKGFNNLLYSDYQVHHNVFTDLNPEKGLGNCMSFGALSDIKFYNNTCYFRYFNDLAIIELNAGVSSNIDITNNIFYTSASDGAKVINTRNDATVTNVTFNNNVLFNYEKGFTPVSAENNHNSDPELVFKSTPSYLMPVPSDGSWLIDQGTDVGLPYSGAAPDIGAHEDKIGFNLSPVVALDTPLVESVFVLGDSLKIVVEAHDPDGRINKVEVFMDSDLLVSSADSLLSFYFTPTDVGRKAIKVFATDNHGVVSVKSTNVVISVPAVSVEIDQEGPLNIKPGEDTLLSATVMPEVATYRDVIWSSGDPGVAIVDHQGNVTAFSEGSVTITATSADGGFTDQIKLNIASGLSFVENGSAYNLRVYPNPLHENILYICSPDFVHGEIYHVKMYSSIGKCVFTGSFNASGNKLRISFSELPENGLYIIIARGKGKLFSTKTIVWQ